jgi:hypothetical protein
MRKQSASAMASSVVACRQAGFLHEQQHHEASQDGFPYATKSRSGTWLASIQRMLRTFGKLQLLVCLVCRYICRSFSTGFQCLPGLENFRETVSCVASSRSIFTMAARRRLVATLASRVQMNEQTRGSNVGRRSRGRKLSPFSRCPSGDVTRANQTRPLARGFRYCMSDAYSQVNEKSYSKQESKAQECIRSGSRAQITIDWSSN